MKKGDASTFKAEKKSALSSKILAKSEKNQKASDNKFVMAFKHSPIGMCIFTIDEGRYVDANDVYQQFLGYSREELIGRTPEDINLWVDISDREKITGELLQNGKVTDFELRFRDKQGNLHWGLTTTLPINIAGESYLLTQTKDITGEKTRNETLEKSEAKYRLLADHMKDTVWIMDTNLKVTYVSPSAEKLLGRTQEEIINLPLEKMLTAESYTRAIDFYSIELPKGIAAPPDYVLDRTLELEFVAKDGHCIWVECMFSLLRDENGNPTALLGESRNITERRQMESALRNSEENFRRSLDDSPLGVRIVTIEGKTIYANRTILDTYGYDSLNELENTPLKERYTPESFAEFQIRKTKRVRGEKGPSEYEISIIRKNGEIRHLYVFRKKIEWNGCKQYQVIYQDITLRRQAEEKLNEILENLRRSIKITIQVLGTASEAKDPYMAGHQKRVADLARAISTEMKLPHDKIEAIRMASAIHDIGKISVPAEILCKPAILSDLEFELVKGHPLYGYEIMKEVESPWPLADIVYQHHERMNGSGYPQGLKGADILLESRILAVADVVEAMMSYRPYRPALEQDIALAEIENNAGILYDSPVVDACLKLFREKSYQFS